MDGGKFYSLFREQIFCDEARSVPLMLSRVVDQQGDSSFTHSTNNREWKSVVVDEQHFYFTRKSLSRPIDRQLINISLDSIKAFNANYLYWLPGNLLFSTILEMKNLEELSIKGTQVSSLLQVFKILQACPKIVKLDFTYTEQTMDELVNVLKKENISITSLPERFKQLTSLKMSTTAQDCPNCMQHDPWWLIIKILTCCRDCTDLKIEVTYTGQREPHFYEGGPLKLFNYEHDFRGNVKKEVFPMLDWMKSLKSLVLVKLGPYATFNAGNRVLSRLLVFLFEYLFPSIGSPAPRPLQRLWIEDYEVYPCSMVKFATPKCLQSYRSGESGNNEHYDEFIEIEHLAGKMGLNFSHPMPKLSKLKFVTGSSDDYEKFYKFCEAHTDLEHISIEFQEHIWHLFHGPLFKLTKLRSLSVVHGAITKEFMEAIVEAYPNLENLKITTFCGETDINEDEALRSLRFPHLTRLSLCIYELGDGASLPSIATQCPKLKVIYLDTAIDSTPFLSNFKDFLRLAPNLRDFRMKWDDRKDKYPATAFLVLRALLAGSVQLERLALIDGGSGNLDEWESPSKFDDSIVGFISKMVNLSCVCLTFKQINVDYMNGIKQRVTEEVVAMRPSLWFHIGRSVPKASDAGVPSIHYHQIVQPMSFDLPLVMDAPLKCVTGSPQITGSQDDVVSVEEEVVKSTMLPSRLHSEGYIKNTLKDIPLPNHMKKELASKVDEYNINNTEPMELVVTASAGCVMLAEAAKGAGLSKEERAKAIDICISMLKDMKM